MSCLLTRIPVRLIETSVVCVSIQNVLHIFWGFTSEFYRGSWKDLFASILLTRWIICSSWFFNFWNIWLWFIFDAFKNAKIYNSTCSWYHLNYYSVLIGPYIRKIMSQQCFLKKYSKTIEFKTTILYFFSWICGLLGWVASCKLDLVLRHVSTSSEQRGQLGPILFMPMVEVQEGSTGLVHSHSIHILLAKEDHMVKSKIKEVEKYTLTLKSHGKKRVKNFKDTGFQSWCMIV